MVELRPDIGSQVEGQADIVAAARSHRRCRCRATRGPGARSDGVASVASAPDSHRALLSTQRSLRHRPQLSPCRSRGESRGTDRLRPTGSCRRARSCCARWSSGSTTATPGRRGSRRYPGQPEHRRRHIALRPTARRREREQQSSGSRADRRRSGTRSPDHAYRSCAAEQFRHRRTAMAGPAADPPPDVSALARQ